MLLGLAACSAREKGGSGRYDYPDILDISYTPSGEKKCTGWFTDAGCWWGFTPPEKDHFVNGFCGPFHLDMNRRAWYSDVIAEAGLVTGGRFVPDTVIYYPGELYMRSSCKEGSVEQRLIFVDKENALLRVKGDTALVFSGRVLWGQKGFTSSPLSMEFFENHVVVRDTTGEGFALSFPPGTFLSRQETDSVAAYAGGYIARCPADSASVLITFFMPGDDPVAVSSVADGRLPQASGLVRESLERWNTYLDHVIRADMPAEYSRVAAKAVTTLVSNWRSPRGDLLHEGVVPSHAAGYFVGFWGWDSWKHAAALAAFAPELAKNQVRAMFDYQLENGMIVDCIFSDKGENNLRDSKPPLAAWAVNEIYKATGDSAFVKEMYPGLVKYFYWWYQYRDHNKNGVCEFGSCDGTLEAAAWESGMDNAIRFDDARMVYNGKCDAGGEPADNGSAGWSMDRESVDLNSFLCYEHRLLGELAPVAGVTLPLSGAGVESSGSEGAGTWIPVIGKPYPLNVADYFFCRDRGFFFDRMFNGKFVEEEGTEASIPLWTGLATQAQADSAARLFTDPGKFATYIPFPTIAADNPKFTPKGYWRGPIWLDQVYFGINGLRKYGYAEQADLFTRNVFDRLYGLKKGAPVHENYNTHDGSLLKAPHFSWSSAHLLMLYREFGKKI